MKDSKVVHGISIGDTWSSKDGESSCLIKDIKIACGGNPLIFFIENGETKFIEHSEKFCERYVFSNRNS